MIVCMEDDGRVTHEEAMFYCINPACGQGEYPVEVTVQYGYRWVEDPTCPCCGTEGRER